MINENAEWEEIDFSTPGISEEMRRCQSTVLPCKKCGNPPKISSYKKQYVKNFVRFECLACNISKVLAADVAQFLLECGAARN